jgi:hypothetical protein
MFPKIILKKILLLFLVILSTSQAFGQIQELGEFKDVNLPFTLKYADQIFEKGKYDMVFLKNIPNFFLLKIKKQGKTICLISGGEIVNYPGQGNLSLLQDNPDIPKLAKLTIRRVQALKIAYIIFETGKQAPLCPFYKIRFKFEYME